MYLAPALFAGESSAMSALYWPAEPQTPVRRHPGLELLFAIVPEARMPAVQMPAVQMPAVQMPGARMPAVQMPGVQMIEPQMPGAQMPGVQMIEPQMIEAVKTATSKMAVCQLEARMTLDLTR